jgi:S-(hydroxymethyl)glutathione dehydrogenase/alcohol dehydrogenase
MGCCIPTGWGAVFNAAKVKPRQSVAIFGAGGVGCNTIRAAALALAYPIIVVDLEEKKEELAREFGATHFICNSKEDPVPKIQELTGGGVNVAFEVVGDPGSIVQAYWSLGVAGVLIQTGVCRADQQTSLPLIWLPFKQRAIVGHLYGNITTNVDIPKYVDMARSHDMKLDKLITNKFKFEDLNDVAEKMEKRQIKGRWILAWD